MLGPRGRDPEDLKDGTPLPIGGTRILSVYPRHDASGTAMSDCRKGQGWCQGGLSGVCLASGRPAESTRRCLLVAAAVASKHPLVPLKKNKTAITKVSFIGVSYIQYPRSPGTLQSKSSAEVDLEKYIRRKIVSTPNFHGRKTITWGPISCPFCISCSLVPFPLSKNSFDFFHPLIGSAARPKAKIDLVESFEQSQCC